jgi:hypothetical protein
MTGARQKQGAVPREPRVFDPKSFLAKIRTGKTTREFAAKQTVFDQGDAG